MTVKHTPGPWWIESGPDIDLRNHVGISASRHGLLAQVVWKMQDDDRSPRCEATAHLIAAAPDLLEALEKFVKYAEECNDDSFELDHARAAIAKATEKKT